MLGLLVAERFLGDLDYQDCDRSDADADASKGCGEVMHVAAEPEEEYEVATASCDYPFPDRSSRVSRGKAMFACVCVAKTAHFRLHTLFDARSNVGESPGFGIGVSA